MYFCKVQGCQKTWNLGKTWNLTIQAKKPGISEILKKNFEKSGILNKNHFNTWNFKQFLQVKQ